MIAIIKGTDVHTVTSVLLNPVAAVTNCERDYFGYGSNMEHYASAVLPNKWMIKLYASLSRTEGSL